MEPIQLVNGLRDYRPSLWQARTGWLTRLVDAWMTWRQEP